MPECIHISLYKSFEIAPNISYTILFIVNCNECLLLYHRCRGALSDTEIRLSVCPSPRRTADLDYSYAGCLQLTRVRTADPSADGCRSAAIFATVELPSAGGAYCLAARGAILCYSLSQSIQQSTRYKAKSDCSPPGYPPSRLLVIASESAPTLSSVL